MGKITEAEVLALAAAVAGGGGGGGGTNNYNDLDNKPSINGVELMGNKSLEDIGISPLTSDQMMTLVDFI